MKEVQNEIDSRNIEIDKVGIKNLSYPIRVLDKKDKEQHTVASINMYVSLPHHFRGTHMSRFVEVLEKHKDEIAIKNISKILKEIREKFDARSAHIEIKFPYFIEKQAPISKAKSLMQYQCEFNSSLTRLRQGYGGQANKFSFILGVSVPIATLCPCSKAISERGAHNQRGTIRVLVRFHKFLWIEDIVSLVEDCASSSLYSLVKRADEKYITEHSYDNPVFVEDVVRNVALKLNKQKDITWYNVEVESYESIHNHDAYALVEKK